MKKLLAAFCKGILSSGVAFFIMILFRIKLDWPFVFFMLLLSGAFLVVIEAKEEEKAESKKPKDVSEEPEDTFEEVDLM